MMMPHYLGRKYDTVPLRVLDQYTRKFSLNKFAKGQIISFF
jgi:hypothetical protein